MLQSSEMGGSGGRHFRAMLRINGLDAGSPIIPLRPASLDKKIIPSDFPQKATFPWEKGCSGFAPEYWCSTAMMNSDGWFHSEFKKDTLMTGSQDTTYYEMSSLRRQQARTWGQRRRKGICSPAPSPDLGTSSLDAGLTERTGRST